MIGEGRKIKYIYKHKEKVLREDNYFPINASVLSQIEIPIGTPYIIVSIEYLHKGNTQIINLETLKEFQTRHEEIKKEQKIFDEKIKHLNSPIEKKYRKKLSNIQKKVAKYTNTKKIIIQSRQRIPEKNNKWGNWIFFQPLSSKEEIEPILKTLKATETDSLQYRLKPDVKEKEKLIETQSSSIEKPFVIQYKERHPETKILGNWQLLERFETEEKRNEYFSIMSRDKNRIYRIQNIRITRQHLNKKIST
jgi:hypothetical protein